MRVAVTGHMNLTEDTVSLVRRAIGETLASYSADGALVGVSCLARGADQVFAAEVLRLGGSLEVVLPCATYRETKVKPDNRAVFDDLIRRAVAVRHLPFPEANRDAYTAANEALLASADRLLAVWDGQPSNGKGGTADTVETARATGLTVDVIWPTGASRDS